MTMRKEKKNQKSFEIKEESDEDDSHDVFKAIPLAVNQA
jgi:hypothetical protein